MAGTVIAEHPLKLYLELTDQTNTRFARQIGFSSAYIGQIIAGRRVPEKTLEKISSATGITMFLLRAWMRKDEPELADVGALDEPRG